MVVAVMVASVRTTYSGKYSMLSLDAMLGGLRLRAVLSEYCC